MNSFPAVTVHGFEHARAALRLARPVTLLSARGAALAGGCLWWIALVAAARAEFPDTPCTDILDCADAPGRAMAALRAGQKRLILWQAAPGFAAVRAAAATLGATVDDARPPALDLDPVAWRGPWGAARLARWLAAG